MEVNQKWLERYKNSRLEYNERITEFSDNLELYRGTHEIDLPTNNTKVQQVKKASLVRNLTYELIESQIDSTIPAPKVTPRNPSKENQRKAKIIEDMLRNELDRLPMEYLNDEDERNTYINGGSAYLVEWDNTKRTHNTVGELSVRLLNAGQLTPQPGVFYLEYMDYLFLSFDETKARIKAKYGVDVDDESVDPDVSVSVNSDDLVTQVVAYYVNDEGGIGVYSWAGNTVLEDLKDYQARLTDVCEKCGKPRYMDAKKCVCGSKKWKKCKEDYEELPVDVILPDGKRIPAMSSVKDENGNPVYEDEEVPQYEGGFQLHDRILNDGLPLTDENGTVLDAPVMGVQKRKKFENTKIPYYVPNVFPVVVRKNISAYGKFLGDSDCAVIRDLQMSYNKLATSCEEKLLKGGSVLILPEGLQIETNDKEMKVVRIKSPDQRAAIGCEDLAPNIQQDLQVMAEYYAQAKSTLGITDAFQGKPDVTATSGVAKQFSAQQSAGRIESKRRMKSAAYAQLFEIMFKFMLAYADEPRHYVSTDNNGKQIDQVFNRYDFLELDEAGEWYYDDQYLFSTDISGTLAQDRQAMWQETRLNFQNGAFGLPQNPDGLMLFWREMENLHYPNASRIVAQLEQNQKMAQIQQQMMQQKQNAIAAMQGMSQGLPPEQVQSLAAGIPQQMSEGGQNGQ